jgi:hypothetical protein
MVSVKQGSILEQYSAPNRRLVQKNFIQTWGDIFELSIPTSDNYTGHKIRYDDNEYNIFNYGAKLRVNENEVRLVVIDGQHRLAALKYLANSDDAARKEIVQFIEIPVCIVFSPEATEGSALGETVTKDLRELFVTINMQGKKVSGHFIALLKDMSLAAMSTRCFADNWKAMLHNDYSRLHLLEWNQREDKLASQRLRVYSVTTVSIVNDCLEAYLFDTSEKTKTILNLMERSQELLEADPSIPANEIANDRFHPRQIQILKEQINRYISPSLDMLLRFSRPYKEMQNQFDRNCAWLDEQVAKGIIGAGAFKMDVLQQYRDVHKFDAKTVAAIRGEFKDLFSIDDSDTPYFLNVFQQGLLRAWINLSISLGQYEISPPEVATALTGSLQLICFSKEKGLFDFRRQYTQRTLFNGENVVVTKKSKDLWLALIVGTFVNEKVVTKFVAQLRIEHPEFQPERFNKIKEYLHSVGQKNATSFVDDYKSLIRKDFEKNWREKELDEAVIAELARYSALDTSENREKFDEIITKLTDIRVENAAEKLSNVLEVAKDVLF